MDLYVCFHFFLLELIICSCSIEGFCTKTADLLSCFLYIISLCEVKVKWLWKSLSCVQLLATPWTAAHQAPPSMGFSRQEYWSGVPLPSPDAAWLVLIPQHPILPEWRSRVESKQFPCKGVMWKLYLSVPISVSKSLITWPQGTSRKAGTCGLQLIIQVSWDHLRNGVKGEPLTKRRKEGFPWWSSG